MIISALKEFGMNLMDDSRTEEIADTLPTFHDSNVEIDLSGCILDYPATSRIIDAALQKLETFDPPRSLLLIFDIPFFERHFNKSLFFGSKMLPEDYHSLGDSELRELVRKSLAEKGMTLKLQIVDPRGRNVLHEFVYG